MEKPVLGIDLGTTNSEAAFVVDSYSKIIGGESEGMLPSCVGLNGNDQLVVGREARNQAAVWPERTVVSVKRSMGTEQLFSLGEFAYTPQEISSILLKELRRMAEEETGLSFENAVITVPAYFTDVQRQATKEAGDIAGLNVIRIINEPTAAALAYKETEAREKKHVLVYDLGGGTFDVSIVKIENQVVEVLSGTGDNMLGGDDFDERFVEFLVDHIQKEYQVDLSCDPVGKARLKNAAEKAKMDLSREYYTRIEEAHLSADIHRCKADLSTLIRIEEKSHDCLKRAVTAFQKREYQAALLLADRSRSLKFTQKAEHLRQYAARLAGADRSKNPSSNELAHGPGSGCSRKA